MLTGHECKLSVSSHFSPQTTNSSCGVIVRPTDVIAGNSHYWVVCMRSIVFLGLLVLVGVSGCKPAVEEATLFPVKGRVTLNGAPLTGCTLVLITIKADVGSDDAYSGVLNDKGEFELSSSEGKAGAAAGKYKVTFQMPASADVNSEASRQATMKAMMSGAGKPPETKKAPFPNEYGSFKTSPKEVEITREANELLITL